MSCCATPHLLFDLFQVVGRERRGAVEVVEEPGVSRRAVAELGFRKQLKHGRRQQMGGRMPVDLQRVGIFLGQNPEPGVVLQRLGQIHQIVIGLGHQRGIASLGLTPCNLERSGTRVSFTLPSGSVT